MKDMISRIVSAQQAQLFSALNSQIASLIESNIQTSLARFSPNHFNTAQPQQQHSQHPPSANQTPPHMQTLPAVEQQTFREMLGMRQNNSSESPSHFRSNHGNAIPRTNSNTHRSGLSSELYVRPDKVLQTISNWKIKFSGSTNCLSVDSFIDRVEALTAQTLYGDFELLCNYAGSLFEGKATDWFWRFHQRDPRITWPKLCKALREQYRDSRTDIDFLEMVRDRKQKPNETFDSFYEAVNELVDRLRTPIEDTTLVEILRRNLLPDIQHEILNTQIYTVQHLRDVCRRREFFMADIRRKHGVSISRAPPIQKRISEIDRDFGDEPEESLVCESGEVAEVNLICWNCQKPGHRYQDCLSVRTIFCYGCGKVDTYKPNCKHCQSKNLKFTAQRCAHKKPSQEI